MQLITKHKKMEAYYLIQDIQSGNYWDDLTQHFRAAYYAYKMDVDRNIAFDEEFIKARLRSNNGVSLVKVYN